MQPELKVLPAKPIKNNAAGRLLSILKMFSGKLSYPDNVTGFFGEPADALPSRKTQLFMLFMIHVAKAFEEFIDDLKNSPAINEDSLKIILDGVAGLRDFVYPQQQWNNVRALERTEIAVLSLSASLMPEDSSLSDDDMEAIRDSITGLRDLLEDSSLDDLARKTLLDIIRLSNNALEFYAIHGIKGFREAVSAMFIELLKILRQEGEEVAAKSWWTKATKHVKTLEEFAAKLLKYKSLIEAGGKFLLGDSSGPGSTMAP